MTDPRAVQIAVELQKLGVSQSGVIELLSQYPYDLIEQQLAYLPYRKAKRPEAFIIDAVRNAYSPPKEAYHAKTQTHSASSPDAVDESAEPAPGPLAAEPQRHRTPGYFGTPPLNGGLEPSGPGGDDSVSTTDAANRARE